MTAERSSPRQPPGPILPAPRPAIIAGAVQAGITLNVAIPAAVPDKLQAFRRDGIIAGGSSILPARRTLERPQSVSISRCQATDCGTP